MEGLKLMHEEQSWVNHELLNPALALSQKKEAARSNMSKGLPHVSLLENEVKDRI